MSNIEYPKLIVNHLQISNCYDGAVKCIIKNRVHFDLEKYNKSGALNPKVKHILKAGGHYDEP